MTTLIQYSAVPLHASDKDRENSQDVVNSTANSPVLGLGGD